MKYSTFVALLAIPAGLFASDASDGAELNHDSKVVAYTSQQEHSSSQRYRAQPSRNGAQSPSMHSHQESAQEDQRYGFHVFGDYLYWKPYLSNTPWALVTNNSENDPIPADGVQKITYNNLPFTFSGDSGFRLGAGDRSDWHKLGFDVEWTRFHTTSRESVSNNAFEEGFANNNENPKAITGIWSAPRTVPTGVAYFSRANGTLKIDQIDFIFSTMYSPVKWFEVVPGVGIRTYLSTFELDTLIETNRWGDTNVVSAPPVNQEFITVTQDFDSVGALFSLRSAFDIYGGLRSVADFALGLVSGNLKNSTKNQRIELGASVDDLQIENKDTIKTIIDFDLGLQYEWFNDPKNFGILLEVAYEVHFLPDFLQPLLLRNTAFTRVFDYRSDLSFQGVRARAGISF